MKHSDFSIGTRFFTAAGPWICTDVGARTIAAIYIPDSTDEALMGATLEQWMQGPPYVLQESLFNEKEIKGAYQDWMDAIRLSLSSRHPGFLGEDTRRLMNGRRRFRGRQALFHHERMRKDELLHPYDLTGEGKETEVQVLEVFTRTWTSIPVAEFLSLPIPTDDDVARLADYYGRPPRPGLSDLASPQENIP